MIEVLWFTLSCFLVVVGTILFFSMCIVAQWVRLQERIYEDEKRLKEEMTLQTKSHMESVRRSAEELMRNPPTSFTRHMEADQIKRTIPVQ
jgi:hypothetical protein